MSAARLEVHEHTIISGPRRGRFGNQWPAGTSSTIAHSHEGGDVPHTHPDTGPAAYTIDKDEWARKTGLNGGGKKKFTAKPSGEQFPLVPRAPQSFDVFVTDSALVQGEDGNLRPIRPSDDVSSGGNTAERMRQAFGLTARVHDLRSKNGRLP